MDVVPRDARESTARRRMRRSVFEFRAKDADERRRPVTTWGATTSQILALREHLIAETVMCVVIESTSDYWKPFYYLLYDALNMMLEPLVADPEVMRDLVEHDVPNTARRRRSVSPAASRVIGPPKMLILSGSTPLYVLLLRGSGTPRYRPSSGCVFSGCRGGPSGVT